MSRRRSKDRAITVQIVHLHCARPHRECSSRIVILGRWLDRAVLRCTPFAFLGRLLGAQLPTSKGEKKSDRPGSPKLP